MTKILSGADINFGLVDEFKSKVETVTVENIGTETVTLTGVDSDNADFVVNEISLEKVQPKFPANSTIYLADNGLCQNLTTGAFYTSNQGYGVLGTTNGAGLITLVTNAPFILISAPTTDQKLETTFAVVWTSGIVSNVNIILESESGYKRHDNILASLGTYNVQLNASDGFVINEAVTITVIDILGIATDSVSITSIATLSMNVPVLTAGTEGTITGTSNGSIIDVYSRLSSPEGEWELFDGDVSVNESGDWTATGTIADAGTYDFTAVDTTDPDGYVQVDDVVVASGDGLYIYTSNYSTLQKRNKSDLAVVASVAVGSGITAIACDSEHVYVQTYYDGYLKKYTKNLVYVGQISNGINDTKAMVCTPNFILLATNSGMRIYNRVAFTYNSFVSTNTTEDIFRDVNYVYLVGTAGWVLKYNISTMAQIGTVSIGGYIRYARMDLSNLFKVITSPELTFKKMQLNYTTEEYSHSISALQNGRFDIDLTNIFILFGTEGGTTYLRKYSKAAYDLVASSSNFCGCIACDTTLWD